MSRDSPARTEFPKGAVPVTSPRWVGGGICFQLQGAARAGGGRTVAPPLCAHSSKPETRRRRVSAGQTLGAHGPRPTPGRRLWANYRKPLPSPGKLRSRRRPGGWEPTPGSRWEGLKAAVGVASRCCPLTSPKLVESCPHSTEEEAEARSFSHVPLPGRSGPEPGSRVMLPHGPPTLAGPSRCPQSGGWPQCTNTVQVGQRSSTSGDSTPRAHWQGLETLLMITTEGHSTGI